MRQRSVNDEAVFQALFAVFREVGYEGATLARLAEATGLKRASLYHRFPGGKEEMALAVLEEVGRRVDRTLIAGLQGPGSVEERLDAFLAGTSEFYKDGRAACLWDVLSVGAPAGPFTEQIKSTVAGLEDALASVILELGLDEDEARRRSRRTLVLIQGGLVMARALGDLGVFEEALAEARRQALAPADSARAAPGRSRAEAKPGR